MIFLPAVIHIVKSCERHLVGDDPYQFESLANEQLLALYYTGHKHKVLIMEIETRLKYEKLSDEDRHLFEQVLEIMRK